MSKILIIGAGELGKALSAVLSGKQENKITLWDKNKDKVPAWQEFNQAIVNKDIAFLAVPTSAVEIVTDQIKAHTESLVLVILSKGLNEKGLNAFEVASANYPQESLVIISGPMIAEELIEKRSTCAMTGGQNSKQVISLFDSSILSLFETDDLTSLSWLGVLKNIYAILLGMNSGKGKNYLGCLVKQSLEEMKAIVAQLGGEESNAYSYAGLADLIATGFSPNSSNFAAGQALAVGETPEFAEGLAAVINLSQRLDLSAYPLLNSVYQKVLAIKKKIV